MVENFDPNTIEDESLRQVFIALMNLVETLSAKVQEQSEEIQRLRDENNRLKGEQGKPKIKANKPALDVSSEKERRESKPHHKAHKQAQIRIDRVEVVKMETHRLPADALFKGYEDVIVQDIEFRTENVTFRHARNITHPVKGGHIWPQCLLGTKVSLGQVSEPGCWLSIMQRG